MASKRMITALIVVLISIGFSLYFFTHPQTRTTYIRGGCSGIYNKSEGNRATGAIADNSHTPEMHLVNCLAIILLPKTIHTRSRWLWPSISVNVLGLAYVGYEVTRLKRSKSKRGNTSSKS